MKSITIMAALAGLTLAGCEYHDYETLKYKGRSPVADVLPSQPTEPVTEPDEITPPSEEGIVARADDGSADGPEEESPAEEEYPDLPFFVTTREEPRMILHSSESAEDLAARLRGETTEGQASEPVVLLAERKMPPLTVIVPQPSFGVEDDAVILEGSDSGDLYDGGTCSPAPLGAPRVGAGLAVTIDHSNASFTRQPDILTGLRLGCRQTVHWDIRDQETWNASISLEDGTNTAKAPVGHALVGIRLLKCETPFGPTAEYCGAEAFFRKIRGDGTVEGGNPAAVRIPANLGYFGPNSTWVNPQPDGPELTAQCPGLDHAVTALRFRRQAGAGHGPGAVSGVEITCSNIVKN